MQILIGRVAAIERDAYLVVKKRLLSATSTPVRVPYSPNHKHYQEEDDADDDGVSDGLGALEVLRRWNSGKLIRDGTYIVVYTGPRGGVA